MNVSWMIPKVKKWPWQRWYNYDRTIASVWIRCLQLIPFLQQLNINSQINRWDCHTDIALFLRRWDRDALQKAISLKKRGIKVILDTPVNYFSSQRHPQFDGPVHGQFADFAEIADCIFCASSYIATFGKTLGFNTVCLEDSVNFDHFSCRKQKVKNTTPSLIWSGVSVKAGELNFLKEVIIRNNWKVIIISDKRPELEFPYHFVKWHYLDFPKEIIRGDVAVFPRHVNHEYDKGHSFFKIGVFLAEHVPVVCSPVPSYSDVTTNDNGRIVNRLCPIDWCDAIDTMINGNFVNFSDNPICEFSTRKMALKYKICFDTLLC